MEKARPTSPAVVLVDDEPEILFSYTVMLRRAGVSTLRTVGESRDLLPLLAGLEAGAIVLDLQMPHLSGKELLDEIVAAYPHVPVIIVTAANELDTAVACMKAGAFDYLVKPIEPNRFVTSVRKALEMNALRREVSSLKESLLTGELRNEGAFAGITTRNARMKALFGYLEAIAGTDQPVLITGETGAGKELAARALHCLSRRPGEFVAVNIAGLDDLMFSDTLFGHTRGAFTGADQAREGMVARAAGGTLFLDEIGDMGTACQVKLLRLLQDGEYHPLGSDAPRAGDARIVAATNRDMESLMAEGKFRKDLYYRLYAHRAHIPPLRERPEDIPLLLEQFLQEAARFLHKKKPAYPPDLHRYLAAYHFPGNVRELRSMVFDAVARHKGGVLSTAAFRESIGHNPPPAPSASRACPEIKEWLQLSGRIPTLREMEECLVAEALNISGGNQGAAAGLLGISRQALNKRLSRKGGGG
ncbi:MAG TPA: sigma-54 dependent transcriptional regulator [Geobacteraceae bacterium]